MTTENSNRTRRKRRVTPNRIAAGAARRIASVAIKSAKQVSNVARRMFVYLKNAKDASNVGEGAVTTPNAVVELAKKAIARRL